MNLELGWDPYDDSWSMGFVNLLELAPLLEELELHVSNSIVHCAFLNTLIMIIMCFVSV